MKRVELRVVAILTDENAAEVEAMVAKLRNSRAFDEEGQELVEVQWVEVEL